jgi:tetrapyrrole methylase family protein/MazG family protein
MIYVVGLGPGDPQSLPPRAFALLTSGLPTLVRTVRHPVWTLPGPLADAVAAGLVSLTPLDDEYEANETFDDTYDAIVARVLRAASVEGDIVYAVPGHPLVGETTVARLLPLLRAKDIPFSVVGAPSFIDAVLEAVAEAVTDDLHVIDALALRPNDPAPPAALRTGGPLLLYQVHSRDAASLAKLSLMRAGYPDDFTVTLVRAAGVPDAQSVRPVALYALDRGTDVDHLTSLWVPPLPEAARRPGFDGLVRIMARLRDPASGCPWDLKQSHATLKRYLIEETYEVIDAIDGLESDDGDPDALCEELGDLLLQVVFHAQLAGESGYFDAEDVCSVIVEKLIRRHPHIFGDAIVADADEVLRNWYAIKAEEKGKETRVSVLDGVPPGLPGLLRALEISKRAVKVGFEWPDTAGVLAKVDEEIAELRAEVEADAPREQIAGELGDVFFTLVNVARHLGIDPEEALREQLRRFTLRFQHIEAGAKAQQRTIESLTLAEMDAFWQQAKHKEKQA